MRRRATPSSSIRASAVVNCSLVAIRTERSRSSSRRPSRIEPRSRSLSAALEPEPLIDRRERFPDAVSASRSEARSLCSILVNPYEVDQGGWDLDILIGAEWVESKLIFESGNHDRKG